MPGGIPEGIEIRRQLPEAKTKVSPATGDALFQKQPELVKELLPIVFSTAVRPRIENEGVITMLRRLAEELESR
jgi:hypothetical protein